MKHGKYERVKKTGGRYQQPQQTEQTRDAAKRNDYEDRPEKSLFLYVHDLIFLLAGVLLVMMLCFRVVIVDGPSMNRTLVDGDYIVLLGNVFYQEPQYGDIIVACKESFRDGEPIIKRVIATEGQTVDIDFKTGTVYVDGVELNEYYINSRTFLEEGTTFPITVQEDCVFVMGDNRNLSLDSRNPDIGQIDKREIMGKAIVLLLPGKGNAYNKRDFSRFGVL